MKKFLLLLIIVCLSCFLLSCNLEIDDSKSSVTTDSEPVSSDSDLDSAEPESTDTDTASNQPKAKDGEVNTENMDFVLKGIVLAVNEKLEIEVIESDYAFGEYHVIVPSTISITDSLGNKISLSDLKENDTVLISYSGQTMLSYPPQIVAYSICLMGI